MIASDFGTGQVFLSMMYFFLFFIWIYLLIVVFSDIFRSPDLSGGIKAVWTIFVIVMPYLGVFVYLIARGGKMHEHAVQQAQAQDQAMRAYVRDAAASPATEVAQLAELKEKGVIDEAEFQKLKAKAISS